MGLLSRVVAALPPDIKEVIFTDLEKNKVKNKNSENNSAFRAKENNVIDSKYASVSNINIFDSILSDQSSAIDKDSVLTKHDSNIVSKIHSENENNILLNKKSIKSPYLHAKNQTNGIYSKFSCNSEGINELISNSKEINKLCSSLNYSLSLNSFSIHEQNKNNGIFSKCCYDY